MISAHLHWKDELPLSWKVVPLKAIAQYFVSSVDKLISEGEQEVELCNYTDVYKNEYITSSLSFMKGSASEDEIKKFTLNEGDIIITKDSETWDDIGVPSFVLETKTHLLCGYHLAIIRVNQNRIIPKFLFRCLQSKAIRLQLELASSGVTRFGLPKESIGRLKLPIPDLIIQQSIADLLDKELDRLDDLVSAKGKLLELLTEKRQVLISETVTKGTSPDAEMKQSGIHWLGKIPRDWQVERSRWLFKERNQRSETGDEELLTVSHITGVTSRSEKDVNMFEAETTAGYKKCSKGDLVINTLWAWMGAMGISPKEGIVSPAYHVYIPNQTKILPEYVAALVRTSNFAKEVTRYSTGVWSSRLRLYPEGFYEVYFPVPPIREQEKIVTRIANETRSINEMMEITARSIALLKERREALIFEAVTGQTKLSNVYK